MIESNVFEAKVAAEKIDRQLLLLYAFHKLAERVHYDLLDDSLYHPSIKFLKTTPKITNVSLTNKYPHQFLLHILTAHITSIF